MNDRRQVLRPTFNRPATSVNTCIHKQEIRGASDLESCTFATCATAFASRAQAPRSRTPNRRPPAPAPRHHVPVDAPRLRFRQIPFVAVPGPCWEERATSCNAPCPSEPTVGRPRRLSRSGFRSGFARSKSA